MLAPCDVWLKERGSVSVVHQTISNAFKFIYKIHLTYLMKFQLADVDAVILINYSNSQITSKYFSWLVKTHRHVIREIHSIVKLKGSLYDEINLKLKYFVYANCKTIISVWYRD